jgi:putative spermidine/putrescine transport system substrate-binding protein
VESFAVGFFVLVLLAAGCQVAAATPPADWSAPPDLSKAQVQARDFQTYGMPDNWANYGESFAHFCQQILSSTCGRTDTDLTANEEITRFDAERQNPIAVLGDFGLFYAASAEKMGLVPNYLPPSAAKLPEALRGKAGGWVAVYSGVPGFVVNTDVVKNVPRNWNDLIRPEYRGLIGMDDPRRSAYAAAAFVAWSFANGGDENNLDPGVRFARQLLPNLMGVPQGNAQSLEKGEVPIQINYDFNLLATAATVEQKGVHAEVIIPGVSVYVPSVLMLNRYNTAKQDLGKLYMEWALSDEGQLEFARFGARPIRYVLGNLQVPSDAKEKWLPDAAYKDVRQVQDWSKVDPARIAAVWENQVLSGP